MIRVKMGNAGEQVCTGWINCAWVGEKPLKLKRFYNLDEVHPTEALVITHILGSLMSVLLFCKDSKPRRGDMFIVSEPKMGAHCDHKPTIGLWKVNPGPTHAPFVFQRGGGKPSLAS